MSHSQNASTSANDEGQHYEQSYTSQYYIAQRLYIYVRSVHGGGGTDTDERVSLVRH